MENSNYRDLRVRQGIAVIIPRDQTFPLAAVHCKIRFLVQK